MESTYPPDLTVIDAILQLTHGTPWDYGEAWWRADLYRHYIAAEGLAQDWGIAIDRVLHEQGTSVEVLSLGQGPEKICP